MRINACCCVICILFTFVIAPGCRIEIGPYGFMNPVHTKDEESNGCHQRYGNEFHSLIASELINFKHYLKELVLSQVVDMALGLQWGTRRSHMIAPGDDDMSQI